MVLGRHWAEVASGLSGSNLGVPGRRLIATEVASTGHQSITPDGVAGEAGSETRCAVPGGTGQPKV